MRLLLLVRYNDDPAIRVLIVFGWASCSPVAWPISFAIHFQISFDIPVYMILTEAYLAYNVAVALSEHLSVLVAIEVELSLPLVRV